MSERLLLISYMHALCGAVLAGIVVAQLQSKCITCYEAGKRCQVCKHAPSEQPKSSSVCSTLRQFQQCVQPNSSSVQRWCRVLCSSASSVCSTLQQCQQCVHHSAAVPAVCASLCSSVCSSSPAVALPAPALVVSAQRRHPAAT
jgi:hypothetical protein